MRGLRYIVAVVLCSVFSQAQAQSIHPSIPGGTPILPGSSVPPGSAVLHVDPDRGTPRLLAGSAPARGSRASVEDAAWSHLRDHAALYRIQDALSFVRVRAVHHQEQGPLIVAFQAEVHGVPVFLDELKVAMRRDRSLLGISGSLSPHLAAAGAEPPSFRLRAEDAIAQALRRFQGGAPLSFALVSLGGDDAGLLRYQLPGRDLRLRVGKVFFDTSFSLAPSYYVEVIDDTRAASYVIGAGKGDILFENDLLWHARYRVWANEDGTPHPSPLGRNGIPYVSGASSDIVASTLVTLEHGPITTQDPWLGLLAQEARGNNVEVAADAPSGLRALTSAPGEFDYVADFDRGPNTSETQIRAGLVQAFYTSNWIHDLLYDAGFDEAWRNAQASNYGRGGAGGDRLLVGTQSPLAPNNGYVIISADGDSPVMKLGLYGSYAARDIALDSTVVTHEYGHILSSRLVGNGNGLTYLQARSLGEGWSDFLALLLVVREENALLPENHAFQGSYPIGSFSNRSASFGFRRYPYSTSLDVNPLSFAHISNAASLPRDVPRSSAGGPNASVHAAGEVWASMLWEIYVSFLNDPGLRFEEARQRMLHLLVASLKLTPTEPTYIEARDAVLLAADGLEAADRAKILAAFAKRGAGVGAVAPHPLSRGDRPATESFHGAPGIHLQAFEVFESARICDHDGIVDAGEVGTLRVTIGNGDLTQRDGGVVIVSTSTPGVEIATSTELVFDPLLPLRTASLELDFTIGETDQLIPLEFDLSLMSPGRPAQQLEFRAFANYDRGAGGPSVPCLDPPTCAMQRDQRVCNGGAPVASAIVPRNVVGGAKVDIDASASFHPDDEPLEFTWRGQYWHRDYSSPIPLKFVDDRAPITRLVVPRVPTDSMATVILIVRGQERTSHQEFDLTIHAYEITANASSEADVVPSGGQGLLLGAGDDPAGNPLRFQWRQIEGPEALIDHPMEASTTFTAPVVDRDTPLRFALTVSKAELESEPSEVEVTVLAPSLATPPNLVLPEDFAPRAHRRPTESGGCMAAGDGSSALLWLALTLVWLGMPHRRRSQPR